MTLSFVKLDDVPWETLTPGVHCVGLKELQENFAFTSHRKNLLNGFIIGATELFKIGCSAIYLDGSFVTKKECPGDFDACWDMNGVNLANLPKIFDVRAKDSIMMQKHIFGGEFYPNGIEGSSGILFMDFFQQIRQTNEKKGIIMVKPGFGGENDS